MELIIDPIIPVMKKNHIPKRANFYKKKRKKIMNRSFKNIFSYFLFYVRSIFHFFFFSLDENENIDPEAPPANYGRRRSRAVLYQLSGHYKQDNMKSKLKINNVS